MGFFSKISEGLKKTRESLRERFDDVFSGGHVDDDLFDELEEALVLADTGAVTAGAICEELRKRVKKEGVTDSEKVREMMYEVVAEMLRGGQELNIENKPAIIMMIGVNGAGKPPPSENSQKTSSMKAKRLLLPRRIPSVLQPLTSWKSGPKDAVRNLSNIPKVPTRLRLFLMPLPPARQEKPML